MSVKELAKIIRAANKAYYSDGAQKPLMTDDEYDNFCAELAHLDPQHAALSEGHTGSQVTRRKTVLPYELWSLDKIKPDTPALDKWRQQFAAPPAYVVSCKLDGISALCQMQGQMQGQAQGQMQGQIRLFTRGNGRIGQDISHLWEKMKQPMMEPKLQPLMHLWAVRGEIIIKRAVFQAKYSTQFNNARNFVGGLIQQKVLDGQHKARDLDFVAYEVVEPAGLTQREQMAWLTEHGFQTAPHECWTADKLTQPNLTQQLLHWRKNALYENDGVVVAHDAVHPRVSGGNPVHAFAFKMQLGEQTTVAQVIAVHWAPSKDGYLKPRVQFKPMQLGGVRIEYATGFNAKFIKEQQLGPGAKVELVRSGDVIPHIVRVLAPATEPVVLPPGIWTASGVDLQLGKAAEEKGDAELNADINAELNADLNAEVEIKVLTNLFAHLGVDGVGPGIVQKIYAAGHKTLPKILLLEIDDFLKIEGFQLVLAQKVHTNIRAKVAQASLAELMHASNLLGRGFGLKKITAALQAGAPWPWPQQNQTAFDEWLKACSLAHKEMQGIEVGKEVGKEPCKEVGKEPLKKYVLTGFRDKALVTKLAAFGAEECAAVSKNTWCVIVSGTGQNVISSKVVAAQKLNVPIKTVAEILAMLT